MLPKVKGIPLMAFEIWVRGRLYVVEGYVTPNNRRPSKWDTPHEFFCTNLTDVETGKPMADLHTLTFGEVMQIDEAYRDFNRAQFLDQFLLVWGNSDGWGMSRRWITGHRPHQRG